MTVITPQNLLRDIKIRLQQAEEHHRRTGRPLCTLAYAQSLDGSIACNPMRRMGLSSHESLVFTHQIRALHDTILVGIRTVLADNPSLSVRLIPGKNPRPVVLDSKLRTPLGSNLLNHGERRPLIATGQHADTLCQNNLESKGAQVLRLPNAKNGWVALEPLLDKMGEMGVRSLMVEGGARVLTSFMKTRLVDQMIITVAPMIVGGVRAFGRISKDPALLPRLEEVYYTNMGRNMVVWGLPSWEKI